VKKSVIQLLFKQRSFHLSSFYLYVDTVSTAINGEWVKPVA